jgi:hypothetical protein
VPQTIDDGLTAQQRYALRHPERRKAAYKKWREKNADRLREKRRDDYAKDPEKFRFINLKQWYGLSREEYESMLAAQNDSCAICTTPFKDLGHKRRPAVDHDHVTGKVRGILCAPCNVRLDVLENISWRESAERYLARTKE